MLPPPPRSSDVGGTVDVGKHGCGFQPMLRVAVAEETGAEVEEVVSEEAEADTTWIKLVAVSGLSDELILEEMLLVVSCNCGVE